PRFVPRAWPPTTHLDQFDSRAAASFPKSSLGFHFEAKLGRVQRNRTLYHRVVRLELKTDQLRSEHTVVDRQCVRCSLCLAPPYAGGACRCILWRTWQESLSSPGGQGVSF